MLTSPSVNVSVSHSQARGRLSYDHRCKDGKDSGSAKGHRSGRALEKFGVTFFRKEGLGVGVIKLSNITLLGRSGLNGICDCKKRGKHEFLKFHLARTKREKKLPVFFSTSVGIFLASSLHSSLCCCSLVSSSPSTVDSRKDETASLALSMDSVWRSMRPLRTASWAFFASALYMPEN